MKCHNTSKTCLRLAAAVMSHHSRTWPSVVTALHGSAYRGQCSKAFPPALPPPCSCSLIWRGSGHICSCPWLRLCRHCSAVKLISRVTGIKSWLSGVPARLLPLHRDAWALIRDQVLLISCFVAGRAGSRAAAHLINADLTGHAAAAAAATCCPWKRNSSRVTTAHERGFRISYVIKSEASLSEAIMQLIMQLAGGFCRVLRGRRKLPWSCRVWQLPPCQPLVR